MFEDLRAALQPHEETLKLATVVALLGASLLWLLSDPAVRAGADPGSARRAVVLLHGHGASKTDLEPLARQLARAVPDVAFVLPNAPHRSGFGRTWYPSFTTRTQAEVQVRLDELRAEARDRVLELVEDLEDDGLSTAQIYVGGFSQGATVALDVLLQQPADRPLAGLISLSGGALDLDLGALEGKPAQRAFVSHGRGDRVLGSAKSRALADALEAHGHQVEYVDFTGGHEIPDRVVERLEQFLAGTTTDGP